MLPTYKETIDLLRKDRSRFVLFSEEQPIFQILNKEFVESLAEHLKNKGKILEVGAGSGLLSKELKECGIDIIATDNGSWKVKPLIKVEQLSYQRAIQKYRPAVVICSWMPPGEDWTSVFRRSRCVQEYILIGYHYSNICGELSSWKRHFLFKRVVLDKASSYAICRMDSISDDDKSDDDKFYICPDQVQSFRRIRK